MKTLYNFLVSLLPVTAVKDNVAANIGALFAVYLRDCSVELPDEPRGSEKQTSVKSLRFRDHVLL